MDDLVLERSELGELNVFCVKLIGTNRYKESRANAEKLCDRLVRENRAGLLMDYTQCTLDHTTEQFAEIVTLFSARVPKSCVIAYVFAPENMMHALLMTKRLHQAGFTAGAFPVFEKAEEFLEERLS
ncbi:hypothetical protein GCM10011367_13310 [Marinicauda pacifica]|uniref:STAS/SEC14 domain-containing protein n=1 Tax=Marinicauda pacifica TaxID=1133559 RepID=A0A4S2HA30_9PROT|nr:hypothetical protein [Marinicauda pacifica]TGY92764.1 hypothetical protein E5162_06725 [Marinicauda pacifica]GGE40212.1 hypothetical protein GCM10011367_13310 [Marinicauda pacifica]